MATSLVANCANGQVQQRTLSDAETDVLAQTQTDARAAQQAQQAQQTQLIQDVVTITTDPTFPLASRQAMARLYGAPVPTV